MELVSTATDNPTLTHLVSFHLDYNKTIPVSYIQAFEKMEEHDGGEEIYLEETMQTLQDHVLESNDRIVMLEEVATHLNNEMKIMKQLITAQIAEVNRVMDVRFKEMNDKIDSRLAIADSRIDSIHQTVSSLSDAVSKNMIEKQASNLKVIKRSDDSEIHIPLLSPIHKIPRTPRSTLSTPRNGSDMLSARSIRSDVDLDQETFEREIFAPYRGRLNMIFKNFVYQLTDISRGDIRKVMARNHFIRFFNDSKLSTLLNEGFNCEVVWANALKNMGLITSYSSQSKLDWNNSLITSFSHSKCGTFIQSV